MKKLLLALKSFEHHTSSESWLLQKGLEYNGWVLCGVGLKHDTGDVGRIIEAETVESGPPDVVIVSDHREWDGGSFQGGREAFYNLDAITCPKLSILKDAQWAKDGWYHKQYDHLITYYHTAARVSGLPAERMIRTYHCVDADKVPHMRAGSMSVPRRGCLLSGANNKTYYPLRARLWSDPQGVWDSLAHPGYQDKRCHSDVYLATLNRYKVAICTASVFDYALRKIIEAVACGCVVVTNLSYSDKLPMIDGSLVRVGNDCSVKEMREVVSRCIDSYDSDRQREWAAACSRYYDYRSVYRILDTDIIEKLSLSNHGSCY